MHKKVTTILSALLMVVLSAMVVMASNAPDYSKPESWYKVPEITKDVDTFYILATEYMGFKEGDPDYAEMDNPELVENTPGQYALHASAYEESTNVFLPYYRQTSLRYAGEVWKKTGDIADALLGKPYEDITAALDYYFENYNGGRPFILAGHSQGSAIAKIVLERYFKEHPEYYKRMVAAYLIGYAVTKDYLEANPHLKFATGESDTGVIVSWNTEGKKNVEANVKTAVLFPNAISINPLNWKLDDTYAPASENLGSLVLNEKTGTLEIGDVGADAQVVPERGVVVTNAKVEPMPAELAAVASEFFGPDGRHESDYTFYYNNIKANVAKRVAAYKKKADLVVYGKIFTAEGNKIVEAFAVKDGRYVYVGDRKGAEAFVEKGKTEVLDYTGKGLIMPGCGNGHAHYSMGHAIQSAGTIVDREDSVEKFLAEIVPSAVKKARDTGATAIFGQGWNIMTFPKNMPTRQQLDAICSDIPIYFADEEGHKGLVNTIALVNAGIMKEDGTVLKPEIRGGEIEMGADGTPTGYLKEQAGTYVRSFLDNENLFTVDMARANMAKIQEQLLSEGYTMYLDGYSTYFFNDNFYEAANQMDKSGDMHFVLGTAYELDSWMDVDAVLAKARDAKKFASTRVKPNWLKLFMDGTVETGTGFIEPLYPDGHQGIPNWSEEELTDITRKANESGITMHVHVMGNKGVNRIVNAFINGGRDEMRNTLVHVYHVNQPDYQRMAEHNIHVTAGMLWHHATDELQKALSAILPEGLKDKGYPMKSYFDHGINVSSHSDFPALSGAPDDPFGIMEIAVTGVYHLENAKPWWPEELITREQALTALTINVAKQMFIEDERGSVKEGKYADFLFVDKDVLTCPVTEIHTAKPEATYFEGKKVFEARGL
ncbi:MAG: amidohydrolase family protein [Synergistaceae bacterium]|nr:amidohydrolase family protein [Synergistaceae bacterium]MBQ6417542.1 amidohydrolase family protein [Synergistaceae bacterium]MBQ6664710.1 amidohydrolase family protein [Synergistaceae bacterium]MBQ6981233.1 amidohydrolase family protein [Synergistaceae bacterium]